MIVNLIAFYYCTCDSENDSRSISALVCDSIWRAWTTSQYRKCCGSCGSMLREPPQIGMLEIYIISSYEMAWFHITHVLLTVWNDVWQTIFGRYLEDDMNIMLYDLNAFWGWMIWYEIMRTMLWYRTWHDMIGCQIESYHIICNPLISLHQWTIYR